MNKLIIVGNKIIDKDISKKVDNFDYVIRLNRMSNYGNTGYRTDLWLADFHNEFFKLVQKPYDKYLNAKTLLINTDRPITAYIKGLKYGIIAKNQLSSAKKIQIKKIAEQLLGKQDWIKNKTMPTNYFLLTKYIIDNYLDKAEIWTTGIDIEKRDVLFNTHSAYENSWHNNIGQFESMMLNKWIQDKKLHVLEC